MVQEGQQRASQRTVGTLMQRLAPKNSKYQGSFPFCKVILYPADEEQKLDNQLCLCVKAMESGGTMKYLMYTCGTTAVRKTVSCDLLCTDNRCLKKECIVRSQEACLHTAILLLILLVSPAQCKAAGMNYRSPTPERDQLHRYQPNHVHIAG